MDKYEKILRIIIAICSALLGALGGGAAVAMGAVVI